MVPSREVVLVGTHALDHLVGPLASWLRWLDFDAHPRLAPQGQLVFELLDDGGETAARPASPVALFLRASDLDEGTLSSIDGAVRDFAARRTAPTVVFVHPAPGSANLEARLTEAGIDVVPFERIRTLYPVATIEDPIADGVGLVPHSEAYSTALATCVARWLTRIWSTPIKAIAVDADHTLWRGVVAEDGVSGVVVDAGRRRLLERLATLRAAGVLLVLASKNDPADVRAVFDGHPDLPLGWDDFAEHCVGWDPKPDLLAHAAERLGLGLDGFVFLDDSPVECAAMRAALPEVLTVRVPEDVGRFVDHTWVLDARGATVEDRARADFYARRDRREEERTRATSLAELIERLELKVDIEPLSADRHERARQLIARTNQMNIAPSRRIADFATGAWWSCTVRDRFGAYGMVGLVGADVEGARASIHTFLLSCRALGRGVEHRMLAHAADALGARGVRSLSIAATSGDRNEPARRFVASLPGEDVNRLAALRYDPSAAPAPVVSAPRTSASPLPKILERTAEHYDSVERIRDALIADGRRPRAIETPFVHPTNAVERSVAACFVEVLGVARVGAEDGFFELGGQSIDAVRLLSLLRSRLGTHVAIHTLFDAPTVRAIALHALEQNRARVEAGPIAPYLRALERIDAGASTEAPPLVARTSWNPRTPRAPQWIVPESPAPTPDERHAIQTVAVLTVGRSVVDRAVDSYRHAFDKPVVVVDDRRGPSERRAGWTNRAARDAYAQRLARASGVPAKVVEFALLGDATYPNTSGAARNTLLVGTVGELCFSADDDTLAGLGSTHVDDGVAVAAGRDPSDVRYYEDTDAAAKAVEHIDAERIESVLTSLVGRPVAALGPFTHPTPVPSDFRDRLGRGVVRVTATGLAGDCGWGAPFGFWGAPMGVLTPRPGAVHYDRRDIVKSVPRPTLTDGSAFMSTTVALDNRDGLVPFVPVMRGQDVVFSRLLSMVDRDAVFSVAPFTLQHRPIGVRTFSAGELFRAASGFDLAKLVLAALDTVDDADPSTIGAALVHLGEAPDLAGAILESAREGFLRQADRLEAWRPSFTDADAARSLDRYLELYQSSLAAPSGVCPLDLVFDKDLDAAWSHARSILIRFGRVVAAWPDIVDGARRLKAEGVTPW
ncbi:MAG: HAD-IIIC family phosphatase [Deltaproteobacteria bacterium]